MASHRSRGSSMSSRTQSVKYRPPNIISRGISSVASGLNTHRIWIDLLLFGVASVILLGISSVAYWSFYYWYIPQISLQHDIHLQFGNGHPYGFVELNSELRSFQNYDVSIDLHLPRTPSNLDAGNFMVDLSIYSRAGQQALQELSDPTQGDELLNLTAYRIAHSRRTGILTYASHLVDTVNRMAQMPFYVVGMRREAERLNVPLMDSVQFTRGKNHMPGVLKVEIQSERQMQVYGAGIKIDARFSGLRYLMYHWKLLSFITFSSAFWATSMLFAAATWIYLASGGISGEAEGLSDGTSTKKDEEDEQEEQSRRERESYYHGMDVYSGYNPYIKEEPIEESELPTSEVLRIPQYREEASVPVKQEEPGEEKGKEKEEEDSSAEEIVEQGTPDSEDGEGKATPEEEEQTGESGANEKEGEEGDKKKEEGEKEDKEVKKEDVKEEDKQQEETKILESMILAPLTPASGHAHKAGATTQSQHQSDAPGEEISTIQRRKSRPLSPVSGEEDDEYDHL